MEKFNFSYANKLVYQKYVFIHDKGLIFFIEGFDNR